jgi:hypothetical protein
MHTEPMATREKVFNIRFTAEEWKRVNKLAGFHGVSAAALFRFMLKQEERRTASAMHESDDLEAAETESDRAAVSAEKTEAPRTSTKTKTKTKTTTTKGRK